MEQTQLGSQQSVLSVSGSGKHFIVRARRLLYLALVRSHLDYYASEGGRLTCNLTTSVERVQRRATNFILGIPSCSVPYKDRLPRTNLLPLTYWHEVKDLLFIHGCLNGKYNINSERSVKLNLLPK